MPLEETDPLKTLSKFISLCQIYDGELKRFEPTEVQRAVHLAIVNDSGQGPWLLGSKLIVTGHELVTDHATKQR